MLKNQYQTLKGVCFFEAASSPPSYAPTCRYQTLKGVCFFEAHEYRAADCDHYRIPDAERRLLL